MVPISKNQNDPHRYDDLLELSPPVSKRHPRMDLLSRAAQFAPFAALTGHSEAIEETAEAARDKVLSENAGVPWEEAP